MPTREVRTTLTARDIRHLLDQFGLFEQRGRYDHKTNSFTYPRTIKKKLRTLERRLETAK